MSSQLRYLDGDTAPVILPINASFPIEDGDLVYRHPADGTARTAAQMTNQGSASLNQDAFQQYFVGVAVTKCGLQPGEKTFRLTPNPNYVVVATSGAFLYGCPSHQWSPGDLVGVYADSTGCQNQQVMPAASASLAIGVARPGVAALTNAVTQIAVLINSTLFGGGVQNQVAGSGSGQ